MTVRKSILFILLIALPAGICPYKAMAQQSQEYSLKAAFLYRFLDYIEWVDTDNSETFNIAVLGESDIVAPLTEISKDKKVANKKIVVKQYQGLNDLGPCQIIFISRNYKLPVDAVITKMDAKPVLIVTEKDVDFDKGSQINFSIAEDKLKFAVDLRSAVRSGIKISSQMLQHALVVKR